MATEYHQCIYVLLANMAVLIVIDHQNVFNAWVVMLEGVLSKIFKVLVVILVGLHAKDVLWWMRKTIKHNVWNVRMGTHTKIALICVIYVDRISKPWDAQAVQALWIVSSA